MLSRDDVTAGRARGSPGPPGELRGRLAGSTTVHAAVSPPIRTGDEPRLAWRTAPVCGRYTLYSSPEDVAEYFDLDRVPELPRRYNIAPTQDVPLVRRPPDGEANESSDRAREMVSARWGLVPFWADDPDDLPTMINARAETVAEKPAFRVAFSRRRCVLPASGFYEWRPTGNGKQPYHIRRVDETPLALAGLWERWRSDDGRELESCLIIVTEANELLRPIHDRMPVILRREEMPRWLDPDAERNELEELLRPYGGDDLRGHPVSRRVNSPANDDPSLVQEA